MKKKTNAEGSDVEERIILQLILETMRISMNTFKTQ
jgi:hypothetical protein